MKSTPPSQPERIRLTITVSQEVHETFKRLSAASGMSIGRSMGEWLSDTLDAATFMAHKMEEARAAPRKVAQELHQYALGLTDMTADMLTAVRRKAAMPGRGRAASAPGVVAKRQSPPASNTGVISKTRRVGRP